MQRQRDLSSNSYCVRCGARMHADWDFCPGCGRKRDPDLVSPASRSRGQEQSAGMLIQEPAAEPDHLQLDQRLYQVAAEAEKLDRAGRVHESEDLLDEALAGGADCFELRIARCRHFGRLGLLHQARDELSAARGRLPLSDTRALLVYQELDRWLQERLQTSFTREAPLPAFLTRRIAGRRLQRSPSNGD